MRSPAHASWVDVPFLWFRGVHFIIASCAISLLFLILASIPFVLARQSSLLLDKPLIVGAIGVAWVLASIRAITRTYISEIVAVKEVVSEQERARFMRGLFDIFRIMRKNRGLFSAVAVTWACIMAAYINLSHEGAFLRDHMSFLMVLPAPWYEREWLLVRALGIGFMGFWSLLLLFTAARLGYYHLRLIFYIGAAELIPSQILCLKHFTRIWRTSIIASFTWSAGATLFLIMFDFQLDLFRSGVLAILSALGFFLFVAPVKVLRRKLHAIRQKNIEVLRQQIKKILSTRGQAEKAIIGVADLERRISDQREIASLGAITNYLMTIFFGAFFPLILLMFEETVRKWLS